MIIEAKSPYQPVPLGHTGENIARTVVFDITTWVDRYGSGGVLLLAKRPGDAEPYPVPVIQEEGKVLWPVRREDLFPGGYGEAQLSYIAGGEVVARSAVYRTAAHVSIEDGEAAADPGKGWVETITEAAGIVSQQSAEAAASAEMAGDAANRAEEAADAAKESETQSAASAEAAEKWAGLAQQGAADAGWMYVTGEDGILYLIKSDNAPEDFGLEDNGKGVLIAVYGN